MIKRMISRDVEEFRAFQTRTVEIGRIRIGQYVIPEGKRGRPVKLDRFRLTSTTEDHIITAAALYGGEARPYQPQGGGPQQWEVITEQDALDVWIVNRQVVDPVYEMWGAGRTCVRRCDGEWNAVMQEPCLCNGPDRPADARQLCKITTRVLVMLPKVSGLHSWRLETHSENAAVEMAAPGVAGLVQAAQVPVPATLRLRKEQRRERNHDKGVFETKDFFVPWFDLSWIGAQALSSGPEALTEALTAAGAPAVLAAPDDRRAIEARQVSAPVPAPDGPRPPESASTAGIPAELRAKILADIEQQADLDGLNAIRKKLTERGIDDKAVKDAWNSKKAAVAAAELAAGAARYDEAARFDPEIDREPPFTDPMDEPGWRATEFDRIAEAEAAILAAELAEAAAHDEYSEPPVGHGEAPVDPDGIEDGPAAHLPQLPDGNYDHAGELAQIMILAGKRGWRTGDVTQRITATFGLGHSGEAAAHQLARFRSGMQAGVVE